MAVLLSKQNMFVTRDGAAYGAFGKCPRSQPKLIITKNSECYVFEGFGVTCLYLSDKHNHTDFILQVESRSLFLCFTWTIGMCDAGVAIIVAGVLKSNKVPKMTLKKRWAVLY